MAKRDELISEFSEAEEYSRKKPSSNDNDATNDAAAPGDKSDSESKEEIHITHHHGHRRGSSRKFFKNLKSIFTDKTLNKMLNVFLFCLIVNGVEYFVLINRFKIQTHGAIGKILGMLIILGYMYGARLKLHNVGLSTKPRTIVRGLMNSVVFNLAIIPAYLLEMLYLIINKQSFILRVFAYNAYYSRVGSVGLIGNILLLIIINILSAVMLEVLFRGILVKMGKAKFGFWQTTIIVSIFYSLWYLIVPLSSISAGYKPEKIIVSCLFYIIFEFFLSLKWCMCARASGSIWLSVFDHFFFTTIIGLVRIVNTTPGFANIDLYRNYRLIAVQAISFIFCFAYYKYKMHKKEQILQSVGVHSIYSFDSLVDMSEDDVSRQAERIKTADGEIDSEYLKLLEKLNDSKYN